MKEYLNKPPCTKGFATKSILRPNFGNKTVKRFLSPGQETFINTLSHAANMCKAYARTIHTQNAHTLYRTAVICHAQSSELRAKQTLPLFDDPL